MASGILLASGQNFVIDQMKSYLDVSGVYIGLMTNSTQPTEGAQIGAGITEVSGLGYSRQLSATRTKTGGIDPYVQGSTVTLEASGTWLSVNGYFASLTVSGYDAIWAELFPTEKAGTKYSGDKMLITPKYEQKYENEA